MRFYLDENIPPQVAAIARAKGLDVVSNHELGHRGFPDDAVLRRAALEGRCVVTRDRDDYRELTVRFSEQGWPHAGVLIVPPSLPHDAFARIARALVAFATSHEGGMAGYTITWLPNQ